MNWATKYIDRKEVILHLLFWVCWITSFTLVQSVGKNINEYFVWFMYYLITLPVFVTHTYLIAYWLLPLTFFRSKYLFFLLGFAGLLVVFSVLELIISNNLVFKVFDESKTFEPGYLNFGNIIISGIGNHYIILVFLAIKAGRAWYSASNRKEELMLSKVETEIEVYRYQLQPKLILTLMDELEITAVQNAEKSPEMIIKISSFLNHFLYEGSEDLISMTLEVKLIEEFLEIHKHALGPRFNSNFISSGRLSSFVVPPLILLPLLNDVIKIVYKCNETFESTVIIKGEKKYLLFSFSFWSEKEFRIAGKENVEITRKRLNYSFPGKFRLIENVDENFSEFSIEIFS